MRTRTRVLLGLAGVTVALGAYPGFVLGYTWTHVASSPLQGGRNGPLDAYRHTLASAVVAYTLGPSAVEMVSQVMESSTAESSAMDRHNNRIGAQIGTNAKRFAEIEPAVAAHVREGRENSALPDRTTWLPKNRWQEGWAW